MQGYNIEQAIVLTGVSAAQLRYWDETGIAPASLKGTGDAGGRVRLYGFKDLVKLRTIKELLDHGISLQKIRKAREYLIETTEFEEPLAEARLYTDGESVFQATASEDELLDTLKEGQLALFIDTGIISREVRDRLDDYERERKGFIEKLVSLE